MGRRHVGLSIAFAVVLFSLTGLPPFFGFVAKLQVFYAVFDQGFVWLGVNGLGNCVISLYYYARVVAVNQTGVWMCMRAEIVQMLAQGEAPDGGYSIVNTASVAGLVGSVLLPAYSASKHAVVGMTRTAARTYGRRGIRVNCVCPGPIETPLAEALFARPEVRERMRERQAIERFAEPEEVAALVAWLCSAESSMVTGTPPGVGAGTCRAIASSAIA